MPHYPVVNLKTGETQELHMSMKEYTNKKQYGFGGADGINIVADLKYIIGLEPSLSYSPKYKAKINEVIDKSKFGVKDKLSYIDNICIVARPGVGTITHCVEHLIPLIALYSENDSSEISTDDFLPPDGKFDTTPSNDNLIWLIVGGIIVAIVVVVAIKFVKK